MRITKDKHWVKGKLCRFFAGIKGHFTSQTFKDKLRAPARIGACLFLFALGVFLGLKANFGPTPLLSTHHLEEPEANHRGTFISLEQEEALAHEFDEKLNYIDPHTPSVPNSAEEPEPKEVPFEGLEMTSSDPPEAQPVFTADRIIMPASGQIIKRPGWFYSEVMGDWRYFSGVDIAITPGAQVKAAGAGVIKRIYQDESYGTVIVVDHGDRYETRYGNVHCPELAPGQKVCKGETLGVAKKDVLHFELLDDSEAVDPAGLFDEGN